MVSFIDNKSRSYNRKKGVNLNLYLKKNPFCFKGYHQLSKKENPLKMCELSLIILIYPEYAKDTEKEKI